MEKWGTKCHLKSERRTDWKTGKGVVGQSTAKGVLIRDVP